MSNNRIINNLNDRHKIFDTKKLLFGKKGGYGFETQNSLIIRNVLFRIFKKRNVPSAGVITASWRMVAKTAETPSAAADGIKLDFSPKALPYSKQVK